MTPLETCAIASHRSTTWQSQHFHFKGQVAIQVLGGSSGGKIRNATERLGLVSAISALSYADPQAASKSAESAVEFLCTYYK